jgi:hypothetical protein
MHVKTKDSANQIMNLKAFGCDDSYIARKFNMHVEELRQLYSEELTHAQQDAIAKVAGRLFTIATTGDPRVATSAAIFWLRTQAGWTEPQKATDQKSVVNLNFTGREELLEELAKSLEPEPKSRVQ